ncbi:DUF397 domain-containing protein [Actinoallomurus purpureus]|uniref:DUF397 domain-containing protein n=1 Tax=Actinoallomurus purpureus TaxID=478114 RepID=UPI00209301DB|nr:DUF397 domain-containing protein [Actinoallomurus purpureus]MCO6011646.1 DUF397 domain-containing protein [Actinoallomurus purpureus]
MSGEVRWYKSSRSSDQGGQCIEVARWRKSSRSSDQGGDCVEVARLAVEQSAVGALLPVDSVRDR